MPSRRPSSKRRSISTRKPPRRPTYPQVWSAYNEAQTIEKTVFRTLLRDLTDAVEAPRRHRPGRPSIPLGDAIFCAAYKVYSTFSARRFMTDIKEAHALGFVAGVPHFNTILNYFDSTELTPILKRMVAKSCIPLRDLEDCFAVDSSGFATTRFDRWLDYRTGARRSQNRWVKVHLMCGVRTKIVTAVEIRDQHAADTAFLPTLLDQTAQTFRVKEVLGDKAYYAAYNYAAADRARADPYIMFRSNAVGKGSLLIERMYHLFHSRRELFLAHYHQRSNVESAFSMIKRKFGYAVRSKNETAMTNEVLLKLLCHNLCVLSHASIKFGIDAKIG